MIDLSRITLVKVRPDGWSNSGTKLTLKLDEHEVTKRVFGRNIHDFHCGIIKAIREVERDFAFLKYGNEWRKYVRWERFWDSDIKPEEKALFNTIIEKLNA